MKKNIISALIISAILFSYSAFSSELMYITRANNGDEWWLHRDSIQRENNIVTFWTTTNFNEKSKQGHRSSKVQYRVNCETNQSITVYLMYYDSLDSEGNPALSFDARKPEWRPISSGSVFAAAARVVCN
jgi:hypothetical protein